MDRALTGAGPLPALRDDLDLVAAEGDEAGVMLVDHVRNQHFRLTRRALALLAGWRTGSAGALARHLARRGEPPLEAGEAEALSAFLVRNELTKEPVLGGWRAHAALAAKQHKGAAHRAFHGYIFFRVPLVRPQRFLDAAWPFVAFLFTRAAATAFVLLGIAGLLLVSRQWDVFLATFGRMFSLQGLMLYGVALMITKALHELGHAFMARKHGVKVPVIGAAFILLFPILYTDVTGAWRCTRRKRLMIGAAGMMTELALAVLATLWWVLAPDGTGRDIAFATATLGWAMSLAVNLNPLMRFDGYYLLADALGIDNLQQRGFALARWRLREWLFGFGEAPPETMGRGMRRLIVVHAFATWIYRFFLFLGIALVVYHMTVKLAGIVLFAVEILWFIARPVASEIGEWAKRRHAVSVNRATVRTGLVLGAAGLVCLVPLPWGVMLPAVAGTGHLVAVHPSARGQVAEIRVRDGDTVGKGAPLVLLQSPEIAAGLLRAERTVALAEARLRRVAADPRERSQRRVLEEELARARTGLAALAAQADDLVVRAPAAGRVTDTDRLLAPGQWVAPDRRLASIRAGNGAQVIAFAPAPVLRRLDGVTAGRFVPEEPELAGIAVRLDRTVPPSASDPALVPLLDIHGGPLRSVAGADRRPEPAEAQYRLEFAGAGPGTPGEMRGTLHLRGAPESLAGRLVRRVAGVLVRESGF